MDYSKEFVAQLSDDQLQTEWEKYLAYSYERQRLRGLVQSVLRKKAPERAVNAQELAEGGLAAVKSGDKEILLAKVDGKIHAIDNACGHLAYPLNDGKLDGHVVTCPWHFARFDVRTGEVVSAGIDFENLKPLECKFPLMEVWQSVKSHEPDIHSRRTRKTQPCRAQEVGRRAGNGRGADQKNTPLFHQPSFGGGSRTGRSKLPSSAKARWPPCAWATSRLSSPRLRTRFTLSTTAARTKGFHSIKAAWTGILSPAPITAASSTFATANV